jgi:chromosome segregation ATPase
VALVPPSRKRRPERLRPDQLAAELAQLDTQKDNILDLVAIGEAPAKNVKAKLKEIRDKRERIERDLSKATERRDAGAALLEDALDLLRDLQERYRRMSYA